MKDYNKAYIDFQKFIRNLNKPEYLRVMELQERGAIHFHVLIFDFLLKKDIINAWGKGFVKVDYIDDVNNLKALSNYFSKYVEDLSKNQMIAKNKRLYSTSRNVKRFKKEKIEIYDYFKNKKNAKLEISNEYYNKLILDKECD